MSDEPANSILKQGSKPLCIITGLSGSGKSTALKAFEDLNFFTIDGLPASLSLEIASLIKRSALKNYNGMALGMDMRDQDFPAGFNAVLEELEKGGIKASLIFLEASEAELARRYAETRRPHPLERQGLSLNGAIQREKEQLTGLRKKADIIINSSGFSIHDLRRYIHKIYAIESGNKQRLHIHLLSFGYKYGLPTDADYIFDLRFLPNPYFIDRLKFLSGLDQEVADFVKAQPEAGIFFQKLTALLAFVLPLMEKEGRYRLTIAFGCTGGRHRSVAITVLFAAKLEKMGYHVSLEHRTIESDRQPVAESFKV